MRMTQFEAASFLSDQEKKRLAPALIQMMMTDHPALLYYVI